jgi:hypothetical protein
MIHPTSLQSCSVGTIVVCPLAGRFLPRHTWSGCRPRLSELSRCTGQKTFQGCSSQFPQNQEYSEPQNLVPITVFLLSELPIFAVEVSIENSPARAPGKHLEVRAVCSQWVSWLYVLLCCVLLPETVNTMGLYHKLQSCAA